MPKLRELVRGTRWRSVLSASALLLLGAFSARIPISEVLKHAAEVTLLVFLVHALEREFFWKDLGDLVRDEMGTVSAKFSSLIKNANEAGLEFIYPDRRDALDDIGEQVTKAQNRIWLLGVALYEELSLEKLQQQLKDKLSQKEGFDLRIMLLDSLRSPAVFRSLLESSSQTRKEILNRPRSGDLLSDPLFAQDLHGHILQSFNHCNGDDQLRSRLRFYGLDPMGWLVITDSIAFYEPYTLGRPDSRQKCLGHCFPVFKFYENKGSAFRILENHFERLWETSAVWSFHFGLRLASGRNLSTRLFDRRGRWFGNVIRGLASLEVGANGTSTDTKAEKRREPRLQAEADLAAPGTAFRVRLAGGVPQWIGALVDVSEGGIALRFDEAQAIPNFAAGTKIGISATDNHNDLVNKILAHFEDGRHRLLVRNWERHILRLEGVPKREEAPA